MHRRSTNVPVVLAGILLVGCAQQAESPEHGSAHAQVRSHATSVTSREALPKDVRDLGERSRESAEAVVHACPGVSAPELRECPLGSRTISSVADVRRGVRVRLTSNVGDADAVERRIACHHARLELDRGDTHRSGHTVDSGAPCFLDLDGTEANVRSEEGRVAVVVTTRDPRALEEVRALARQGVPRASTARATASHVHRRELARD